MRRAIKTQSGVKLDLKKTALNRPGEVVPDWTRPDLLLKPFDIHFPPPAKASTLSFEEGKAREADRLAAHWKSEGNKRAARQARKDAKIWRAIWEWDPIKVESLYRDSTEQAHEIIAILLARSQRDGKAHKKLFILAVSILAGLHQIAAAGNKRSAVALHNLTNEGVGFLGKLAKDKPEIFTPFAQTLAQWPASISPHPDRRKDNERLLDELKIGTASLLKVRQKKTSDPKTGRERKVKIWGADTEANKLAIRLFVYISDLRENHQLHEALAKANGVSLPTWISETARLPEFSKSKDSIAAWTKIAWKILYERTGGKPEGNADLKFLRKKNESSKFNRRGEEIAIESEIRSGMQTRLQEAFVAIAGRE